MALSDEDVREILRIIDESQLSELHLTTERFELHVVRGWTSGDTTDWPSEKTRGGQSVVSPGAPVGPGRAPAGATTPGAAGGRGDLVGEASGPAAAGGRGLAEEEASADGVAANGESGDR